MENQHRMIPGYRDMDQATLGIVAGLKSFFNKELHERTEMVKQMLQVKRGELVQEHSRLSQWILENPGSEDRHEVHEQLRAVAEELARNGEAQRWLAMARTDFQVGAMKLLRAVAQPTTEY